MTVAEYLVEYLIELGVTDVFGLPGGVILDLLYAVDKKTPTIQTHLTYHEQGAGFAACGYAQATNKLGVAYSTRGPGFTNMLTAIADAYCDSIPVLFVTAHDSAEVPQSMRIINNQEIDIANLVSPITKYVARIDSTDEAIFEIRKACKIALTGRRGPVVLDFNNKVLQSEIKQSQSEIKQSQVEKLGDKAKVLNDHHIYLIKSMLMKARRPIVLFGDGIRQSNTNDKLIKFVEGNCIPALSSRFSQDIIASSALYFGYIGSHGLRYSNFILSKADLIIAIGNRMAYPIYSDSYKSLMNRVNTIRVDIDPLEFRRKIPNCINIEADANDFLTVLNQNEFKYQDPYKWIATCNMLKDTLFNCDVNEVVKVISSILDCLGSNSTIISDVGNNEFWLSRAYAFSKSQHILLFSKAFSTLGCSIPKAIGVSMTNKRKVICFVGDLGIQINMQELMTIATNNLPIAIVVINNQASGMIRDKEKNKYNKLIHTSKESGYQALNLEKISEAYGLAYYQWDYSCNGLLKVPCIVEVKIDDGELIPFLPKGNPIQKLSPDLDETLYQEMDRS